ncbi:MAG: hypothetical protein B6I36_06680 [Desulfobacteraceae bacterium 4572_35.1]|nr:MAG: hypothetical protein B6I36_06680 [Desulfobacteraceae bacterium 4572_35.1]
MAGLQESLLPIFIEEAEEGLALIQKFVSTWEKAPQFITAEILEEARRAAHTIKGTAGLVKRMQSSAIAKELEELLDSFKADVQCSVTDIDTVINSHAQLVELLSLARAGEPEVAPNVDGERVGFGYHNEKSAEEDSLNASLTADLINDFALPFMMRLHQASTEVDESVKPVCCRFYFGGRQYYLPIEDVVEIAEKEEITILPYGPAYISGLINLRGNVVPVVSLAELEQRKVKFPSTYFLIIAKCGTDLMAFVSDQLPNLSLKAAGHKIDVEKFIEQYSVKA